MEWIELGELANIETGKLNANAADEDGKYPFFTCADEILRISDYKYDKECILIAGNGNLNVKYYSGKFNAYQRTYIVESKDKKTLSIMYLYYFMNTYMDKLRELSIGGVIKYIKLGHLQDAKIPVPPMETQEKIVKVLDQTQALIYKRKEQIETLDQLIESIFYTMFGDPVRNEKGWEVEKLGELGIFKNGLNYSKKDNGYSIKCLGVGDFLRLNKIENMSKIQKIDVLEKPNWDYLLKDEDILFVRSNGNKKLVGRNIIVYPGDNEVTFSGFCIRFRKKINNLNLIFLNYQIKKRTMQNRLQSKIRGANIQNLNQKILSDLDVIYPPLSLQNEFAQKVEAIEKQKEFLGDSLQLLEENYKSIMDKAFKGQLFN